MKVKNILINEKNEFIELLIRELIKYEIGYVHIDNEIHFDNYIFRFYDIQDDKEKIRRIIDEDVLKIEIIKVNDLEGKNKLQKLSELPDILQTFKPEEGEIKENVNTPRLNKKLIKQYNKATNKRLKTKNKLKINSYCSII